MNATQNGNGDKMSKYQIEYQLGAISPGVHRTLAGAYRHLLSCQRVAARGGDCQAIMITHIDEAAEWTAEERAELERLFTDFGR